MGQVTNNKQGTKYQIKNETKSSRQQSRTNSPQKKSSIVTSKRDEGSLQNSNTPQPTKETKTKAAIGVKTRIADGTA